MVTVLSDMSVVYGDRAIGSTYVGSGMTVVYMKLEQSDCRTLRDGWIPGEVPATCLCLAVELTRRADPLRGSSCHDCKLTRRDEKGHCRVQSELGMPIKL